MTWRDNPWISDRMRLTALGSIIVAFVVLGLKGLAYALTGSVALYSDAVESLVNVVTSIVALWAVAYAQRPADSNHPFGHHKAEYVWSVLTGALILVAAVMILDQAWHALRNPKPLRSPGAGIVFSGVATVLNVAWGWLLIAKAKGWRSPALEADGWHVLSDVLTSTGVLVGFILVALTGWQPLDPLTAALAAIGILWSGWSVVRASFSGLMDESVTPGQLADIQKVVTAESAGALETHDLRARHAGQATFIELHLVVPGAMSVRDSHTICDRIEAALRRHVDGARILIHVEPEEKAKLHARPGVAAR